MHDHRELGHSTWVDVAASGPRILLVPLGSCEQHGPHLPLDTDTRIAVAVARGCAAADDGLVVAPALAYGASGEHAGFAGTLSLGTDALAACLVELARSALPAPPPDVLPDDGSGAAVPPAFGAVVFVNGHGGNLDAVRAAVDVLVAEGRAVSAWSPRIPGGDAHAGRTETSLLLAIAPDAVGEARPRGTTDDLADVLPALRAGGVAAVSDNGVLGDAGGATAQEGADLLSALVASLAGHVAGQMVDRHPPRPVT